MPPSSQAARPPAISGRFTTTTVNARADLSLTKTDSPDPVIAGQSLAYTIVVTNSGPSAAQGVVVTDALPGCVTGATYTVGGVSQGAWTGSHTLGSLAAGILSTIVISGTVSPDCTGPLSNTASVASTTTDPNTGNNSSVQTTTVNRSADLAITKTADPYPEVAGQPVTYTITVTNLGPSHAADVIVAETYHAYFTFSSANPTPDPATNNRWTFPELAAGHSVVITVSGSVASDATGTLANRVDVTSSTPDPRPSNNTFTLSSGVEALADVSIDKTGSPDPAIAGTSFSYTIVVSNSGPADAQGVVVTDTLPGCVTGATYTVGGVSQGAWTGSHTLGSLAAGILSTIVISGTVSPDCTGVVSNTASVSATTTDPNPANNTDATSGSVNSQSDVRIVKTDTPDPVIAGEELVYTLSLVNDGPSAALGVVIHEIYPLQFQFASSAPNPDSGTTDQWTFASIAAGGSVTITIRGTVETAALGTATNEATVDSATADPDPDNNRSAATTTVNSRADLSLTKTDSPDPVIAGQSLAYTIVVTNSGPSAAQGVVVTDTLPGCVTGATYTVGGVSQGAWTGSHTVGTLAAGAAETIIITGTVASHCVDSLENTATATAQTEDPSAGNNADSESTAVAAQADLGITKSASPDPLVAGELITYSLVITNIGPSVAQGVVVADTLPECVTNATYTVDGVPQGAWAGTHTLGSVAVGAQVMIEIGGTLTSDCTGLLVNSTSVGSSTTDPDPSDNTSTSTVPVSTRADLSITKSDSPDPVLAGRELVYVFTVANAGPSDAQAVVVTDVYPSFFQFVSATPTPDAGTDNQWTFPTIASGGSRTVTIRGTVDVLASGTVTNLASVGSSTPDPNGSDNTASATTSVTPAADVALVKAGAPSPVTAGSALTYTLTVSNLGPGVAHDVVITESYDPSFQFASASPSPDSGTDNRWSLGTLAPGTSTSITLQGTVDPGALGLLVNRATVETITPDPSLGSNAVTLETPVVTAADLAIGKRASADPVLAGTEAVYTLTVTNLGPAGAWHVVVSEAYDPLFQFISSSPGPVPGTTDRWTIEYLAPGATWEVTIHGLVDPSAVGTVANTARVTAETADPSGVNNSATVVSSIRTQANLSVTKSAHPDPAIVGEALTYTVAVANQGPSVAERFVLVEAFPPCFLPTRAEPAPDRGTEGRWTIPSLAPGESAEVVIHGLVLPTCSEDLVNRVTAVSNTPDPDPKDNSVVLTTEVARLIVAKVAHASEPVRVGDLIRYEVVVTNLGTAPLHAVTVDDDLVELTYTSGDNGNGVLDRGESWTYAGTYIVTTGDLGGPIVNTARATAQTSEGNVVGPVTASASTPWRNSPPRATDLVLTACAGTPRSIPLIGADPDLHGGDPTQHPLTFALSGAPEHGALAADLSAVTYSMPTLATVATYYVPQPGFVGTDRFSYVVQDPFGAFSIGTVQVEVVLCEAVAGGAAVGLRPVAINEIAWGGTTANPRHEWIELVNLTSEHIDLAGWTLRWRRKDPQSPTETLWKEMRLSGRVAPHGYFLLERETDEAVSDRRADLIYDTAVPRNLDLSDSGEVMELLDPTGRVVDTANTDPRRRAGWSAGGSTPTIVTMERVDPLAPDVDENWRTNARIVVNGLDSARNVIGGTPGMRNEDPWILELADKTPQSLHAGRGMTITIPLSAAAPWPWVTLVRTEFDYPKEIWRNEPLAVSGEVAGRAYRLEVDGDALAVGSYQLWVSWGHEHVYGVPFRLVR